MRESATPRMANPVGEPQAPRLYGPVGSKSTLHFDYHHSGGQSEFTHYAAMCDINPAHASLSETELLLEAWERMHWGGAGPRACIAEGGWYVDVPHGFAMFGGPR